MSETPEELQALLSRAKKAGPGPERLASVRARLESQLGPLDAPRAAPPIGGPMALGPRAILGAVAVVVAIGVGTWAGTRPATVDPSPTEPGVAVESTVEAPHTTADPVEPLDEPSVEPSTDTTDEELPAVARPDEPTRTAVRPAPPTPVEPPVVDDPGSSLREEIALLDRALRASEAGDPAGARAALAEHRSRFPTGTLSPERDRMLSELPREPE